MSSHERPVTIELSETLIGVHSPALAAALGMPAELVRALPKQAVTIGGGSKL